MFKIMKQILFFILISTAATAQIRVGTATGTNQYDVTFNPPLTSFNYYAVYSITFTNGNTSSEVSLNPAGIVDTTAIVDNAGSELVSGAIKSGGTYNLRWDGTNLRMTEWVNPQSKNITWLIKVSSYTPTPIDTLFYEVGFLMRSINDLSFTIPSSAAVDFSQGTRFKVKNDSTNTVSLLPGPGVSFKCITEGPWTLSEDEYAVFTKLNSSDTWELTLFKRINLSAQTTIPVYTETSTVGNITTGEDILFTDTITANTLSTNGNVIAGRFSGIIALNGNDKTVRLKFGGTTIATRLAFDSPTLGQGWTLDYQIIRTSATTQKTNAIFVFDGISSAYYAAAGEDMATDIVIQLTGESTSTDDIVKHTASSTFGPGASSGTTPPIEPPVIPFTIVDNTVRGTQGYQWNYVSTWATPGIGIAGWYNETLDYTGTTNSYAEITFNGTRVQFYTEKKNTHGIAEISLDGVVVDTVDLYDASTTGLQQELVFDSNDANDPDNEEGPLTQAVHTLKIRCTGTKNGSSSAYYVLVDYIKVENNLDVPDEELSSPPSAATHFVKTTGSNGGANNCQTEGSPCLTLAYAYTQTTSGDVLSVGPGTFTESSYLVVPVGVSTIGSGIDVTTIKVTSGLNWDVTAGAVDQTKCIFQYTAAGSTAQSLTDLSIEGNGKLVHGGVYIDGDRSNVTLEDVKISNFDYFGAFVSGDNHVFTNVQIINSAEASASFSTGNLMISTSNDLIFDNVDISDNVEAYGVKAWGAGAIIDGMIFKNSEFRVVTSSPYGGGTLNIAFELHNCKPRNCIYENNYTDNSVSIVRPTGFADDAIPSIIIRNSTFDMITKGGGTAVQAPIEYGAHNMEIYGNHFVGARHAFIVHWNASEPNAAVNLKVHHNTFYVVGSVNSPTGICRSSYAPFNGLYFYNNTVHIPPGSNYNTSIVFTGCCGTGRNSTNVQIKNNVIYDQSTADTGVGGANTLTRLEGTGGSFASSGFAYNTVYGMSTSLPSGFTVSNTLTTDPLFTGGGGVNPSPFVYDPFYRPAAGSPLLNSGTDLGLGDGATPDRGRIQD